MSKKSQDCIYRVPSSHADGFPHSAAPRIDPADQDRALWQPADREPNVRYRILGVALVAGWSDGYFTLEGFAPTATLITQQQTTTGFSPGGGVDARKAARAATVPVRAPERIWRAGAPSPAATRQKGWKPPTYKGPQTNHPRSGSLLRSDVHTLFDLRRIAIDTSDYRVIVAADLQPTSYGELNGSALTLSVDPQLRPNKEALDKHRREAGL